MVRVTRPGDPVTVGQTRLGQARVLEERPKNVTCEKDGTLIFVTETREVGPRV